MQENETIITKEGEIVSKKDLRNEIENLLNRFDSANLQGSYLDPAVIRALDINTLLSIRDRLLSADKKAIEDFRSRLSEWE